MKKAAIYYTNNRANGKVLDHCFTQLQSVLNDVPLFCISQHPIPYPNQLHYYECVGELPFALRSISYQMLQGCIAAEGFDLIFFCEHDVFYPEGYFDWEPDNKQPHKTQYYNDNVIFTCGKGYFKRGTDRLPDVMGPCSMGTGFRECLIDALDKRILRNDKGGRILYSEVGNCKEEKKDGWKVAPRTTEYPALDIQHGDNYTRHKLSRRNTQFYHYDEYWGSFHELWQRLGLQTR